MRKVKITVLNVVKRQLQKKKDRLEKEIQEDIKELLEMGVSEEELRNRGVL